MVSLSMVLLPLERVSREIQQRGSFGLDFNLHFGFISIIEHRQRQSNFQLIVITHDEEFVELLGRCDKAEYYWRVTKDEGQVSFVLDFYLSCLHSFACSAIYCLCI